MTSPAVRFRLLAQILSLHAVRISYAAKREAALALCTFAVFCVSAGWVLFTAVSMRLGASFVFKQTKEVISQSAGFSSCRAFSVPASSSTEKDNVMRELRSLDTKILEFETIAALQVPVIRAFYLNYYGIQVSDSDVRLLACFSDISSVSAALMRCCGIRNKKLLSSDDLRKAGLIFPVFIRILSMHRRFVLDHDCKDGGLPETGNLYPLLVSIEELRVRRAESGYRWLRFRYELTAAYEQISLAFYLRMLSEAGSRVTEEGSFESGARYKRFLMRTEKLHRR